jgi:Flp pilus assembly protein TadB
VAVPVAGDDGVSGGTTGAQSDWLTFAMGALAIAAAGLASLILVLTVIAIVAAVAGGVFLVRLWRRTAPKGEVAVPAVASPVVPALGAGATDSTHAVDAPVHAAGPAAASPAMAQTLASGS